jgi:hypothetical protein
MLTKWSGLAKPLVAWWGGGGSPPHITFVFHWGDMQHWVDKDDAGPGLLAAKWRHNVSVFPDEKQEQAVGPPA